LHLIPSSWLDRDPADQHSQIDAKEILRTGGAGCPSRILCTKRAFCNRLSVSH
jgi:hypothetical protein